MALDILHDNWGPYTHTEVENALKAYLVVLEGRINQAIQEGGVGLTDLSLEVQALLNKANTALQPENIAAWAKAQNKPGYTVSEITGVEGFQNLLAKLQDMDQKIQAAAASGGVDPDDEMSSTSEKPVQNKVIKAFVEAFVSQAISNLVNGAPGALDTLKELADALGDNDDAIAALTTAIASKISGIKANGASTTLPVDQNGVVELPPAGSTISPATATPSMDGTAAVGVSAKYAREDHVHPSDTAKLSKSDVSVQTQGDGTVDINVGSGANKDTYTINLNHTHEGMAKLVVDTAANLPDASEMESDTIYGELDDGEIATIYLGGYPFYGGGGTSSGPVLRRPADGATIGMGQTTSGTVSQTINVKGKSLTQALIIQLTGTGYSFGTTQPSGVTRDSATQLTIPASSISAVNSLNGIDIVVVYTGNDTDENASGTLGITSASPDNISVEATLVVNAPVYEDLAGVKLTGTQWMQTDYYPNPNTEFRLECKFTPNARTTNPATGNVGAFLRCNFDSNTSEQRFSLHTASAGSSSTAAYLIFYWNNAANNGQAAINMESNTSEMVADHAVISYAKGPSAGTLTFNGGTPRSVSTTLQTETLTSPMCIGYRPKEQTIYNVFDLTIYSFYITENGQTVRHWIPKLKNGITPGLYDMVNGTFISSETSTELVPVTNS